ncbi:hypothetical protein WA577_000282, partial [Blastocystis sp. JDR]
MVQLLFLFCVYSYILFKGASLISDGSELLLLIPRWSGLIGSIVLPFLGAVPDSAIVLFAGLGDEASVKKQISIGIGALAGSTILLITIPWALSIIAGRVSLNEKGEGNYTRRPGVKKEEFKKLADKDKNSLTQSGIVVEPIVRKNIFFLIFSLLPYFFIQIPAFFSGCATGGGEKCDAHIIIWIAGGCFVYAMIVMVWYFITQYKHSKENIVSQEKIDEEIKKSIRNGLVTISAVISSEIETYCKPAGDGMTAPLLSESPELMEHVRILVRSFFYRYDVDRSGSISVKELKVLLADLGEPMKQSEVQLLLKEFDGDKNNELSFDEFCHFIVNIVDRRTKGELLSVEAGGDDSGDEEEEVPTDLVHLSPKQQQRRIILRSFSMMLAGTAVVILFSDPIVDLLDNLAERVHVNSFYISFIFAPLISNASEVLASYAYAKRKTIRASTISVSTLQGSAIMNNTVCLGVFLIIIFWRKLQWLFTAETISILFVETCIVFLSLKTTQKYLDAILLLCLYPLSIALVWLLEHFGLN